MKELVAKGIQFKFWFTHNLVKILIRMKEGSWGEGRKEWVSNRPASFHSRRPSELPTGPPPPETSGIKGLEDSLLPSGILPYG